MKKGTCFAGALGASLLSSLAVVAASGAAQASDLYDSYKDTPITEPAPDYSISVSGGLTTDYMFRGFSQTDNDPGVFAGAEFAYQWFYVGVWAANVDFSEGELEIDVYAGVKQTWNGIDFDFGVLYYAYPSDDTSPELDYLEVKFAAGTTVADFLALTGAVFYSPDYTLETGEVWTFEGKASAPLPIWDISLGGTVGHVAGEEDDFLDYTYWNIGLSKTFKEHFTVDVRYWDTDVDGDPLADERIVGTVSFSY